MLIAQDLRDRDDLLSYLTEAYSRAKPPSLHCFAFLLNDQFSLEDTFRIASLKGLRSSLHRVADDLYLLNIGVRTSYQLGYLIPVDGNWLFLSDGQTASLSSTVNAFSRNMYSILKLAYLPSKSLLETIERLREKYSSVLVREGTIGTRGQTFRNWKKEPVEFSSELMLELAEREGGKWTGFSFKGFVSDREIINCRVYERGHLTLYSGNFPDFYSDVVLPFFADSLRVYDRLSGLERKDSNGETILNTIGFEFPDDLRQVELELLKASILRKYSAAVTHPGNPMLMMQLGDRGDGSIYDLFAYGRRVELVPQQKATSESLSELVALISDILPIGTPIAE